MDGRRRMRRGLSAALVVGLTVAIAGATIAGATPAGATTANAAATVPTAGAAADGVHFEGLRPAGSTLELVVAGRNSVTPDAEAVALNVTVDDARAPGFVTVYPCGEALPTASNVNYVTGSTVPNAVIAKIGAGGKVCLFTYATVQLIVDLNGYFLNGANYTPLSPARLVDTRSGYPTFDGAFAGGGKVQAGQTLELPVIGRAGVGADAKSVVLNVTSAEPDGPGFLTVFPCGTPVPTASNVNYVAGQVVPNTVFAKLGVDGKVCIFAYSTTHVIVDLNGYFPSIAAYSPLNPARLVDTRPGYPTFDGTFAGGGKIATGQTLVLPILGRGGVALDAKAVVLNVTVAEPEASGFLTVFPCGTPVPAASNVNYVKDQVVPNTVIARVNASGNVCIFAYATTHVVIDLEGFFPADAAYQPVNPVRISDSRP